MTTSAYIHIPFCKSKCNYCSFVSYEGQNAEARARYVKTLLEEIDNFYKDEPLKTLYFGGGTPSLLTTAQIVSILTLFKFEPDAEITLEINPETVDVQYLEDLKKAGINRLSIGIQSFNDSILKRIGRIHTAQKAIQTIIEAKKAGFKNISTDFIYGLPEQSLQGFVQDLKTASELGVTHISLYGLKIEEGCKFHSAMPANLADDDTQADMYLAAIETLEAEGFRHYEISNFAKAVEVGHGTRTREGNNETFTSRHNLNYWNDAEYYGFGAAAHGYIGGVRYSNYADLKEYQNKFDQKEFLQALNKKERLEETIFLGFRRCEGINTAKINKDFGIDFDSQFNETLKKYSETGHLIKTPDGWRLSNEGFLLSNSILSEFI